jgi:hypothetical protein
MTLLSAECGNATKSGCRRWGQKLFLSFLKNYLETHWGAHLYWRYPYNLQLPTEGLCATSPTANCSLLSNRHSHILINTAAVAAKHMNTNWNKLTQWPESARELYGPNDCYFSANLVPTFPDRGMSRSRRDVTAAFFGFLDRSRYVFFQVPPQLHSRGWVDPVPDPLLLRKSGSAGNRNRTSGSVARNSDH